MAGTYTEVKFRKKNGQKSDKIENFEKIDFFKIFSNFLSKLLAKSSNFK